MVSREHGARTFAPGRVNLIGEHTDYNDGLALAFAIELGVSVTVTPRTDDAITVKSAGFGTWDSSIPPDALWSKEVAAVAADLQVSGVHVDVTSTVPEGAGLSSSAAFLCSVALALGARGDAIALARFVHHCEVASGNDVGLLDPLSVLAAWRGHGVLIDFSDTTVQQVPIAARLGFTVVHSGVPRALANTGYVERRDECRRARHLVTHWPPTHDDVATLTDATLRSRLRHVVTENQRVRDAVAALASDDHRALGRVITESHASLRDDFAASLPEIDALVDRLSTLPGVYGARLIGGGFGGCVLVVHDAAVDVESSSASQWRVRPSDGALALLV